MAVNVAEVPRQMVALLTLTAEQRLTVTVAIALLVHPEEVPVTLYDVCSSRRNSDIISCRAI